MSAFRSGPLTMKLNPVKPRPRRSHSWLTACLAEPVIAWLRLGIWIDADAHVEDAADLAWPSAGRFGSGVDPAPHGGNLPSGHGAQRGDPAVGEPGGDSERARPEGPQPYRDRAAGLGFHVEVADAVVAPVLGVAGVCPGAVDDLNGFCEAIEGSGVSQLRKGCWQIRKMFIPMIMTAQLQAKMVATRRLTWAPITVTAAGEQHQRHQRERDAEGQHDLAEHQRLGGVHPGRSSAASCSQRPFASSTRARTLLSRRQHSPLRARRPRPSRNTATSLQPRNHAFPRPCVAAPPTPRLVKIPPTRLPTTYQARAAAPQRMPFSIRPTG